MTRVALVAWTVVAFAAVTAAALVLYARQLFGDPAPVWNDRDNGDVDYV